MIKTIKTGFDKEIQKIKQTFWGALEKQEKLTKKIIEQVRREGDRAVVKFTKKFDGVKLAPKNFEVSQAEWQTVKKVPPKIKEIIFLAAQNIRKFHLREIPRSWLIKKDGKILGKKFTPIEKVGLYIPGGRALYPSTVLMNGIPAKIAGVSEIIMATPSARDGKVSPVILLAAKLAGVNRVFKIGGAQAVAALALGTKFIPKVDKIVGPGNVYVTLAKKLLFGLVGIEGLAGPSELLVLAEAGANPNYIAADLLSQAEHDPAARVWLITNSPELAQKVDKKVVRSIQLSSRSPIIRESLKNSRIFLVKNLPVAFELINQLSPEHLEIMVNRPDQALEKIKNAGAIFVGPYAPTAAGDYLAGPSHTLPTASTARFASGLGVADFMKNSSVIYYSKKAFEKEAEVIEKLAVLEGLDGHALSAIVRRIL
jgi:histidinol dehydrogenase